VLISCFKTKIKLIFIQIKLKLDKFIQNKQSYLIILAEKTKDDTDFIESLKI
jgi:hypothetical protein